MPADLARISSVAICTRLRSRQIGRGRAWFSPHTATSSVSRVNWPDGTLLETLVDGDAALKDDHALGLNAQEAVLMASVPRFPLSRSASGMCLMLDSGPPLDAHLAHRLANRRRSGCI